MNDRDDTGYRNDPGTGEMWTRGIRSRAAVDVDKLPRPDRVGRPYLGMAGWGCMDDVSGEWLSDGEPSAEAAIAAAGERLTYIADFRAAHLSRFGIPSDANHAIEWQDADVTIDDAMDFIDRGCGPGDAAGYTFGGAFDRDGES